MALLVAVDDGYAQTKLYGTLVARDGTKAKPQRFMMRSSARPGRFGLASLSGKSGMGSYSTVEGDEFTCDESLEDAENTQFDTFHTSTMNRVLVHHALVSAGYGGKDVDLVTGLPLSDFYFDGKKDMEKIEAKENNLKKGVRNVSGDRPLANLKRVRVGSQAVAAFVDYYLDDEMQERDVPVERVGVVDIGGRTTDVAQVINGSFDETRSGTTNVGVLDVYNMLAQGIRTRFKTRDKIPLATLDKTVRTGVIRLWGKDEDVKDMVKQYVHEQEVKIAREVERRLGSASNLDVVLFVGGGSALFSTVASHFPNGKLAEDPEFSNARGMYKFFQHQESEALAA